MRFAVRSFLGIIPILNDRKLLSGHAAEAVDSNLKGTDLRPFNKAVNLGLVQDNSLNQFSGFAINSRQIFVFRSDVNATWGPIQHDEEISNKIYIDSGFLGYPIYTTKELGIPGNPDADYYGPPVNHRRLGVPAPTIAPFVTPDAVASGVVQQVGMDDVTLEDDITVVKDSVLVTCETAHGLTNGDRVEQNGLDWSLLNTEYIISTVSDARPNAEREYVLRGMTWTYLFESSASTEERAEGDPPEEGENWWPTPGSGTWNQAYTDASQEDRIYVYTFVTDQGEEGPPSPPSILITIGIGQAVTITWSGTPDVDDYFIDTVRIYRTIPTSTGAADYYFVDEVTVSTGTYYDTKKVIELGEQMPSLEWDPPPEGLIGLITMPNGIMVGFKGNTIYLSEPYQPHAWPRSYTKAVDDVIVAIEGFGQSIVVATDDKPYVGTLTDPLSLTFKKLGSVEPCIAKAACKSLGYGVMYPSPNGLILVDSKGARNVLADMWDDQDWRSQFNPELFVYANIHNERYYLTFSYGGHAWSWTYIFNPNEAPIMITKLDEGDYTGGCVDRDEDKLFMFGVRPSPTNSRVIEIDPDSAANGLLPAHWESQQFVMKRPCNMGAAQVFYEWSESADVSVKFIAYGMRGQTWEYTKQLVDQEPFRLPSGFLAREWRVEIDTDTVVEGIFVAETVDELIGAASQ